MVNSKHNAESPRLAQFPTGSGALTRLAYRHALEGKLVVGPLLRKAGPTLLQIDNASLRLSVNSQIKFPNLVANSLGDELFGFHLAHDFDLREIGTLYYIIASSETLGDALQRAARYSRITNEAVHLRYQKNRGRFVQIYRRCAAPRPSPDRIFHDRAGPFGASFVGSQSASDPCHLYPPP
jgi:hypothetical protein